MAPRSSSPVTVYVELPYIIEQAFSTIAWSDLEDSASGERKHSQVNESEANNQDFGEYGLDFTADSPAALESSLSPDELLPFQGCIIPPLTPQPEFSSEDSLVNSSSETDHTAAHGAEPWGGLADCHGEGLDHCVSKQLHQNRRQEEVDSLEERNVHLRQLASRAKHLASVLEKMMTVADPNGNEPGSGGQTLTSPCKRQRLDEGYETESPDSVEDMLRDISTRCNAVLHSGSTETMLWQESGAIRMHGAFSGLHMSAPRDRPVDGAEAGGSAWSFRTSVGEHGTIRTQVFPHGHAFTSRTQRGGYCFRWVPNLG
ncbi:multicilin [Pholidichthys leucotaenia]